MINKSILTNVSIDHLDNSKFWCDPPWLGTGQQLCLYSHCNCVVFVLCLTCSLSLLRCSARKFSLFLMAFCIFSSTFSCEYLLLDSCTLALTTSSTCFSWSQANRKHHNALHYTHNTCNKLYINNCQGSQLGKNTILLYQSTNNISYSLQDRIEISNNLKTWLFCIISTGKTVGCFKQTNRLLNRLLTCYNPRPYIIWHSSIHFTVGYAPWWSEQRNKVEYKNHDDFRRLYSVPF